VQILLDGKQVPGYDHRVSVTEQIERGDLSGETSTTAASHKGYKPAVVNVRCKVRMEDPEQVSQLRRLYHTLDDAGQAPRVWYITEPTASAMGVFRVQFSDFFKVEPQDGPRVWDLSFALIEVRSIPEKTEERETVGTAGTSAPPAGTQTPDGSTPAPEEDPVGWLGEKLAQFDALLGEYVFGTTDEG